MKTTEDNLNKVLFESHDARLLITDVVTYTSASLHYCRDIEITVQKTLGIWHKTRAVDGEEGGFYSISFLDSSEESAPPLSRLQHAFT